VRQGWSTLSPVTGWYLTGIGGFGFLVTLTDKEGMLIPENPPFAIPSHAEAVPFAVATETAMLTVAGRDRVMDVRLDMLHHGDEHGHGEGGLMTYRGAFAAYTDLDGEFPGCAWLDGDGAVVGLVIELDSAFADAATALDGTWWSTSGMPGDPQWSGVSTISGWGRDFVVGDPDDLGANEPLHSWSGLWPAPDGVLSVAVHQWDGMSSYLLVRWDAN
jgi:hypothetical protein